METTIESRIQTVLKQYGITAAQLADKMSVQRSSISHILSGRNKPSFDFLQKLTREFPDLDANWLLNGSNSIKNRPEKPVKTIIEQDLFSQRADFNEPLHNQSLLTSKSLVESGEKPLEIRPKENEERTTINEITNVNYIKQIIFVYQNNTFEIINQK